MLTLVGPAGIGKTRLARAVSPKAVWVDLVGIAAEDDIVATVAEALDVVVDATGLEALQLGRAWSARGQMLVLDGADESREPLRAILATWLTLAPEGRVLVTARQPLGLPDESAVHLEPLQPSAARMLLQQRASTDTKGALEDGVLEQLGGVPLALALVAPLEPASLGSLGAGASPLCLAWEALTTEQRRDLCWLALLEGEVDADLAVALLAKTSDATPAGERLAALVEASWVEAWAGERLTVRLLQAVRAFVGTTAQLEALRVGARAAAATLWLEHGEGLLRAMEQGESFRRASMDAQRRHLEAIARWPEPVAAARATLVLVSGLRDRGMLGRFVPLLDRMIGDPAVGAPMRALALVERGRISWDAGRRTTARFDFEDALEQSSRDPQGARRHALAALATVKSANQDPDAALALLRESRELALQAGDQRGAASLQQRMVPVLVALDRSRAEVDEALRLALAVSDTDTSTPDGELVRSLAEVLIATGRPDTEVIMLLDQAVESTRVNSDTRQEAATRQLLATVHSHRGVWLDCALHAQEARQRWAERGHLVHEVESALLVGVAECVSGQSSAALPEAQQLATLTGDEELVAVVEIARAECDILAGELAPARRRLLSAIGCLQESRRWRALASAHELLGLVYLLRGQPDEALPRLARGRRTWAELSSPFLLLRSACLMAAAEARAGRIQRAAEWSMQIRSSSRSPRVERLVELTAIWLDIRTGDPRAVERWYGTFEPRGGAVEAVALERMLLEHLS